jgi:hypothetical protein
VSDTVKWEGGLINAHIRFQHRQVATHLICRWPSDPAEKVSWSEHFHGKAFISPKSDTVLGLVIGCVMGDCQPAVLADAIEETLADQDSLDKAQWLLLLLRGDPNWSGSNRTDTFVINRPASTAGRVTVHHAPYHAPYPSSAEEFITTSHTMPSDSCAGGCEVLPIGDNFLTEVMPRAIRDRYRQHASTATELALVVNDESQRRLNTLVYRLYESRYHTLSGNYTHSMLNGVRVVTMPSVPNNAALLLPLSRVRHLLPPEDQR